MAVPVGRREIRYFHQLALPKTLLLAVRAEGLFVTQCLDWIQTRCPYGWNHAAD